MIPHTLYFAFVGFGIGICATMLFISWMACRWDDAPAPLLPELRSPCAFPEYTFEELPTEGTYWVEFNLDGSHLQLLKILDLTTEITNGSKLRTALLENGSRLRSDIKEVAEARFHGPIPEPKITKHYAAA